MLKKQHTYESSGWFPLFSHANVGWYNWSVYEMKWNFEELALNYWQLNIVAGIVWERKFFHGHLPPCLLGWVMVRKSSVQEHRGPPNKFARTLRLQQIICHLDSSIYSTSKSDARQSSVAVMRCVNLFCMDPINLLKVIWSSSLGGTSCRRRSSTCVSSV